jgi:hypothetical protein
MGPYSGLESGVPANIQSSVCGLQIKLLGCCKLKAQCLQNLCQALSSCNNTLPTSSLIPNNVVPSWLTGFNLLPAPQELSNCQQLLAICKLQCAQQQSLCNNLAS